MSDLISRQAVIDVLDVLCQEHRYRIPGKRETYSQYNEAWQDALDRAEGAIFNLPSAQPKINNQINLCNSCRHTYPDCPAGEDDVLYGNGAGHDNICACGKYEVEKRNTGHWVDAGSGMSMWPCKCSVCGGRQGATSKYCPDCGAKMKNNQFNFCDSCEHSKKSWDEPPCDGCCKGHSAYKPKEYRNGSGIHGSNDGQL